MTGDIGVRRAAAAAAGSGGGGGGNISPLSNWAIAITSETQPESMSRPQRCS